MDNNSKRRVGRPKSSPQTGPLVLEGSHTKVKTELEMAEETADELTEYARWVELSSSVTTKDAIFATVDFALRDVFRRDRLWQNRRKKMVQPEPAIMHTTPASQQPPVASLLPPAPSARPIPSSGAAAGIR